MRNRIIRYNRSGQIMPADDLGELRKGDLLFCESVCLENAIGMVLREPQPSEECVKVIARVEGGSYDPDFALTLPIMR